MSNNQDITTNAQTTNDQDVEGHAGRAGRSDQGTMADALAPQGTRAGRSDAPDGEDDVEGHAGRAGRSDQGTMADALAPQGARAGRSDAPDGEDDVEGHAGRGF